MKRAEKLRYEWGVENKKPFDSYVPGSHFKALWECKHGHRWQAQIRSRYRGTDCPYCSGRCAIPGETDLQTVDPKLSAQWDPENNEELTPMDVTPYSNLKVWWRCEKGHSWQASVAKRSEGKGCPYCNHKRADGNNNLAVMYPSVAAEWDVERNVKKPSEVLPHSNAYASWICSRRHRWTATIHSRTRSVRPCQCPYCSGKACIPGETDLATTDPDIAQQWDKERNMSTPDMVSRFSHQKAYWICSEGHVFRASVANRVSGKGCPYCKGSKTNHGKN